MTDELPGGVTVVVPVFNSEGSLPELVARLAPVLDGVAERYEVLLIDDGSRDASGVVARSLAAEHSWVGVIELMRNYGQHNALLCGVRAARFDTVCTMDDDLQHRPETLPALLEELERGFDVVYGSPEREPHGLARGLASQMTKSVLQRAMGADTARSISAFRVFRTRIRDAFAQFSGSYVSLDVLLTWGASRFSALRVPHDARQIGKTNYTFGMLITHALNMMTGFSTWPLRAASLSGFLFLLFGLGVLVFVVGRYLWMGSPVPGFPFLASVIAIFAGAQLFALGVMGEYLARMHSRMMEKPSYGVRSSSLPRS